MKRSRLLIASNNPHKVGEFADLLRGLPIDPVKPEDIGLVVDVVEDGTSYAENARRKAVAFSAAAPELVAIADDSGLEIAAFDGWPGLHSVRFAGPDADDATRRRLVLDRLADRPPAERRARFVCAIALARGARILAEAVGVLPGTIATSELGSGGFGYDSIFVPIGQDLSLGELDAADKNQISHRARAFAQIRPFLSRLATQGRDEENRGIDSEPIA